MLSSKGVEAEDPLAEGKSSSKLSVACNALVIDDSFKTFRFLLESVRPTLLLPPLLLLLALLPPLLVLDIKPTLFPESLLLLVMLEIVRLP